MGLLAAGLISEACENVTVLTVPAEREASVKWFSMLNESGGDVVVIVFYRRMGSAFRLAQATLLASGGQARIIDSDELLVMSPGDALLIQADTANAVNYVISGVTSKVSG